MAGQVNVIDLANAARYLGQSAPAPPTPTPIPLSREAHIALFWQYPDGTGGCPNCYGEITHSSTYIDGSRYPPDALFRLYATVFSGDTRICVRLKNATLGQAVPGSEVCTLGAGEYRIVSEAFALASNARENFVLETKTLGGCCYGTIYQAELVADW